MPEQRVLERRQVFTARQWDGSEEFLDWARPGLDASLLSYNPREEQLSLWGQTVEPGAWVIDRGGWYEVQPDTEAFEKKYEPVTESPT